MRIVNRPIDETPRVRARGLIRDLIVRNGYRQGDRLPTYRQLCQRFDMALLTVQRAMNDLAAEGLVYRHRGRGSFVAQTPDGAKRELRQIGLICPATRTFLIESPYLRQIMTGVFQASEQAKIDLQIMSIHTAEGNLPAHEVAARADGILLLGVINDAYIADFARENVPVAIVDYITAAYPLDYVVVDNIGAGRNIVRHLLELGHQRIAYLDCGTMDPLNAESRAGRMVESSDTVERREAYRAMMTGAGHGGSVRIYGLKAASGREAVREAAADLRKGGPDAPTAIVAYDVSTGAELVAELARQNMHAPRDVSVAGMVGARGEGLAGHLILTHCRADFNAMGQQAIAVLQQRCANLRPVEPHVTRVATEFIGGDTTGPPRAN